MPRPWTRQSVHRDKRFIGTGYTITCAECEDTQGIATPMGVPEAQRQMPREFRKRGWYVGKKVGNDICPACNLKTRIDAAAKITRAAEIEGIPMMGVVTPEGELALATTGDLTPKEIVQMIDAKVNGSKAKVGTHLPEAPREMSRQDKRVIFGKLEEIYLDEDKGYSAGWDDERVSRTLDMPRAWVAAVRDENFGPDKSEDVTKLLASWSELHGQVKGALGEVEAAQAMWTEANTLYNDAMKKLIAFKERLQHAEREVARIEKRK